MKYFIVIIALLIVSCATPQVNLDSKNTFSVKITTTDNVVVDATCTISMIKKAEGEFVLDSFCTAFVEDKTGVYRCEIAVGSDGKPVTKNISISENCKLEIAK